MVLAFVLGTLIESSARQSLLIFGGDPTGFLTRPISGTILAAIVAVALFPLIRRAIRSRRGEPAVAPAPVETSPTEVPDRETTEAK